MASRTAAYGRAAYHWAVKRGSLTVNPFANLPQTPLVRRERVLTDDELRAVWRATEEPGPFNAIVRMLILTGQRREEAAGMTWDELDADLSVWIIPAAAPRTAPPTSSPYRRRRRRSSAPPRATKEEPRLSRRTRRVFRLEQIEGPPRPAERRLRLDAPRSPPNGGHGPAELGVRLEVTEAVSTTLRAAAPASSASTSATLGRGKTRRTRRLGRACRRDRRGARDGRKCLAVSASR